MILMVENPNEAKEVLRLARNRDILGLVCIGQGIALAILLYLFIR